MRQHDQEDQPDQHDAPDDGSGELAPRPAWPAFPANPFEYAPAPESTSVVTLRPRYGLFVDGDWRDAADGATFPTVDPASTEVLAELALAGEADVAAALAAARRAQEPWAALPGRERAKFLYRVSRLGAERSTELAVLENMDVG